MSKVADMPSHANPPTEEMVTVTMMVTPAQAAEWLKTMDVQRRLRRNKVETIKRLVADGRWKLQPHGVVIDRSGKMIDGQHRCTVIIETGKTLSMRVTFNADPALFKVIDSVQSPKGIDDILKHEGVPSGLCAAVGMIVRMKFRAERGMSPIVNNLQPNNDEAIDCYWEASSDLIEAAELARGSHGVAPSIGMLGYFVWRAMAVNKERARAFAISLASGASLDKGNPALLLRNTWLRARIDRKKVELNESAIQIASTLNAFLQGKKMLTWRGVEFGKGKIPPVEGGK